MEHDGRQESLNNLNAILKHSVFNSENELKEQLRSLLQSRKKTKIIISNLKRMDDGELELDFSSDEKDIRCREADLTSTGQATSTYRTSLRAYCSILFLRPRLKITIRRKKVKTKIISKSLGHPMRDSYRPKNSERKNPVGITFGFSCEKGRDESYGMMLYYKNRLIKPFVHVGCQKQPYCRGIGILGVVDVDFLQPIHNKQDFNEDTKYNSAMKSFAAKLNDYVDIVMGETDTPSGTQPEMIHVQCDRCLKWRRLPDTFDMDTLPEKWYCRNNPDVNYNRCNIPEETDDEAEVPKIKAVKKDQIQSKRRSREVYGPTTPSKKSFTPKDDLHSQPNKFQRNVYRVLQLLRPDIHLGNIAKIEEVVEDMLKYPDQTLELKALHSQPNEFHRNVYIVLRVLHPDIDLGDIANIEEVVEDMLKCPDQTLESETLHSQPNEFHRSVYRLLQMLCPDVGLGDIANIGKVVKDLLQSSDQDLNLQNLHLQPNKFHRNVYRVLRVLRPDIHLRDITDIEEVVGYMLKSPDKPLELRTLHSQPSKFHRNVYRLFQLLCPDIHLGDITSIEKVVEEKLKSP